MMGERLPQYTPAREALDLHLSALATGKMKYAGSVVDPNNLDGRDLVFRVNSAADGTLNAGDILPFGEGQAEVTGVSDDANFTHYGLRVAYPTR